MIDGFVDVGAMLQQPDWPQLAAADGGEHLVLTDLEPQAWAPPVLRPSKIICVGLNYREHILEMGHELPTYPTLFAKYPEAIIGPNDPILVPSTALETLDWEGELAIIVGRKVRRADRDTAADAIAGYTVMNDVTVRGYQYRTTQWLQGKTFESTTPLGPVVVTPDDFTSGARLTTHVGEELVQDADTDDLVFDSSTLIAYVSEVITLNPGDIVATGTPAGVGHALKPPRYLQAGNVLTTRIEGLGTLANIVTLL